MYISYVSRAPSGFAIGLACISSTEASSVQHTPVPYVAVVAMTAVSCYLYIVIRTIVVQFEPFKTCQQNARQYVSCIGS
eukprot:COSAG01_NODE_824_length_13299_cov_22.451364_3_plen_79_part_00